MKVNKVKLVKVDKEKGAEATIRVCVYECIFTDIYLQKINAMVRELNMMLSNILWGICTPKPSLVTLIIRTVLN